MQPAQKKGKKSQQNTKPRRFFIHQQRVSISKHYLLHKRVGCLVQFVNMPAKLRLGKTKKTTLSLEKDCNGRPQEPAAMAESPPTQGNKYLQLLRATTTETDFRNHNQAHHDKNRDLTNQTEVQQRDRLGKTEI